MPTLQVQVGPGMTFNDNKLTTYWGPEDATKPKKTDDGLIIPDLVGKNRAGSSSAGGADGVTIHETLDGRVDTNPEVVCYIHTMCAFKVTNRMDTKSFAVDINTVKTIADIVEEMNAIVDNDPYLDGSIYDSISVNNLFQLIHAAHAVKDTNWPCAVDADTRMFGDTSLALFVVTNIEYGADGKDHRVAALSLKCLWSTLSEYEKGEEYIYPAEEP